MEKIYQDIQSILFINLHLYCYEILYSANFVKQQNIIQNNNLETSVEFTALNQLMCAFVIIPVCILLSTSGLGNGHLISCCRLPRKKFPALSKTEFSALVVPDFLQVIFAFICCVQEKLLAFIRIQRNYADPADPDSQSCV